MLFARVQMGLVLISLRASGIRLTGNIGLRPSLPRSLRLLWRGHYAEFKPASGDFWSACLGTVPRPAALLGASFFPARLPRHAFPVEREMIIASSVQSASARFLPRLVTGLSLEESSAVFARRPDSP